MHSSQPLHILIVGRIFEDSLISHHTLRIMSHFHALTPCIFYFMDDRTTNLISTSGSIYTCCTFAGAQSINTSIDYVVTIGGDGTILYAAKEFAQDPPPFITFHQGTLGFLCKFRLADAQHVIARAVKISNRQDQEQPSFDCHKLMRIQAKTSTMPAPKYLLNQLAITRSDNRPITLQIYLDSEPVAQTTGDGLLISTPTGSTAYSLSAGGPVVLSGIETIILTPMAPNSLSFRPICIPASSRLTIKLSQLSKSKALACFDGQSTITLAHGEQIEVGHRKASNADLRVYDYGPDEMKTKDMPTWMQRLKLYLGWNEVFKSPGSEIMDPLSLISDDLDLLKMRSSKIDGIFSEQV